MVRQRQLGPVRFTLIAALLGALLIATAGVVSAAPSISANPATAAAATVGTNTFYIPFTTIFVALDVNCGAPTSDCSVWVARNNAAKATEALFTNVIGAKTLIPATFINDGCFNFRLYDSSHSILLSQMNVGHGGEGAFRSFTVCNADGTARSLVSFFHGGSITDGTGSYISPDSPKPFSGPVQWDSGFFGGVEDSQVWVTESKPFRPITDCDALPYPNSNEVLYAQNVSGQKQDLALIGGGPYCFTLYQGTRHATKVGFTVSASFDPYLRYTGGTANGSIDRAGGTVYFNSGNGSVNALVCVHGASIPGSDILHQVPFAYNSEGYGNKVASFQTAGAGVVKYTLHIGIINRLADGTPTAASCNSGTTPPQAAFFVHT